MPPWQDISNGEDINSSGWHHLQKGFIGRSSILLLPKHGFINIKILGKYCSQKIVPHVPQKDSRWTPRYTWLGGAVCLSSPLSYCSVKITEVTTSFEHFLFRSSVYSALKIAVMLIWWSLDENQCGCKSEPLGKQWIHLFSQTEPDRFGLQPV